MESLSSRQDEEAAGREEHAAGIQWERVPGSTWVPPAAGRGRKWGIGLGGWVGYPIFEDIDRLAREYVRDLISIQFTQVNTIENEDDEED